jgi:predicted Zn-dependent protease
MSCGIILEYINTDGLMDIIPDIATARVYLINSDDHEGISMILKNIAIRYCISSVEDLDEILDIIFDVGNPDNIYDYISDNELCPVGSL